MRENVLLSVWLRLIGHNYSTRPFVAHSSFVVHLPASVVCVCVVSSRHSFDTSRTEIRRPTEFDLRSYRKFLQAFRSARPFDVQRSSFQWKRSWIVAGWLLWPIQSIADSFTFDDDDEPVIFFLLHSSLSLDFRSIFSMLKFCCRAKISRSKKGMEEWSASLTTPGRKLNMGQQTLVLQAASESIAQNCNLSFSSLRCRITPRAAYTYDRRLAQHTSDVLH